MSALELIVAYLRERARLRLFVPLSITLALAGRWLVASSSASASAIAVAALQALALILAFRIWDDIEDRDVDRIRHPTRVVVTAPAIGSLYALEFALVTFAVASLAVEPSALGRLAALSTAIAVLSVWYGVRPSDESHHVLAEHVLATKYPLIAYAVAPELPADALTVRSIAVLGTLYLLICVYEYAEDVQLRQIFTSRRSVP